MVQQEDLHYPKLQRTTSGGSQISRDRIPIIQRVAQSIRQGGVIDVYALVEDLQHQFPHVSEAQLVRIVSEEIVLASGDAVWDNKHQH